MRLGAHSRQSAIISWVVTFEFATVTEAPATFTRRSAAHVPALGDCSWARIAPWSEIRQAPLASLRDRRPADEYRRNGLHCSRKRQFGRFLAAMSRNSPLPHFAETAGTLAPRLASDCQSTDRDAIRILRQGQKLFSAMIVRRRTLRKPRGALSRRETESCRECCRAGEPAAQLACEKCSICCGAGMGRFG